MQVPIAVGNGRGCQEAASPLRLGVGPGVPGGIIPGVPVVSRVGELGSEPEGPGAVPDPGGPQRGQVRERGAGNYDSVRTRHADVAGQVRGQELDLVGGAARVNPAAGLGIAGRPQ